MYSTYRKQLQWVIVGCVTLISIVLFAIGVYSIVKNDDVNNDETIAVARLEQDSPGKELSPIVYENTFLYQEELRKAEEARKQEKLRKQAEAEAEEFLYLQKLTFAEAQGESMEGKILVAASVVNRKNHPTKFPNTIKEVVLEVVDGVPQYTDISYICEEYINKYSWRQAAWEDCRVAAERALSGEDPAAQYLGGPTLYFYNPDKCSQEQIENREGIMMYVVGNHDFHHEAPRD